tara:strand:+ start:584 stop:940 length:357 start_codon:yes stop_codon:yes gene_type:complete
MYTKTFYCYDDTFNAFENAKNHVYQYLFSHGYDTDVTKYITSNSNPAGYDCICVDVPHTDPLEVSTFTGNTKLSEDNHKARGDVWVCPNMLVVVAERKFYGDIYFDGDRLCGVMERSK